MPRCSACCGGIGMRQKARAVRPISAAPAALARAGAWVLVAALGLACSLPARAGATVHKCVVDGSVTFQQGPCPVAERQPQPTLEQLNAERKRKLAAAAAAAASAPPGARPSAARGDAFIGALPRGQAAGHAEPAAARSAAPTTTPTAAPSATPFRCDGRTRCTQMRSCDEARFFLANCPGVKMDGDHDGWPCEQEWCGLR